VFEKFYCLDEKVVWINLKRLVMKVWD